MQLTTVKMQVTTGHAGHERHAGHEMGPSALWLGMPRKFSFAGLPLLIRGGDRAIAVFDVARSGQTSGVEVDCSSVGFLIAGIAV